MKKGTVVALLASAALALAVMVGCSGETGQTTETTSSEGVATLQQPTDFTFDATTGDFTFTATDENTGYYYVRVYAIKDGQEVDDMVTASGRITGGSTGEMSGSVDLSGLSYGEYHVNLMSYAAAGTDYEPSDPVTLTVRGGVGGTLERPELLLMASGNQVELVLDWWTLCDWNSYQYLPQVKFTFYSDAECTQVVQEELVDTRGLLDTMKKNPPGTGYIWGEARDASVVRWHVSTKPIMSMFGGDTSDEGETWQIGFINDCYAYTLDPGTYYVTATAVSDYDFISDSQPSEALEFTLTDAEPSSEFTEATTSMWEDPDFDGSSVTAAPGSKEDRVDAATAQTTTVELVDE